MERGFAKKSPKACHYSRQSGHYTLPPIACFEDRNLSEVCSHGERPDWAESIDVSPKGHPHEYIAGIQHIFLPLRRKHLREVAVAYLKNVYMCYG